MATEPSNIVSIGAALDKPIDVPELAKPRDQGDGPNMPDQPRLPHGCPVKPLGVMGQTHYYLDSLGQLIPLGPREHGKQHIEALFGFHSGMLRDIWPRFGTKVDPETGEVKVTGWKADDAAEHLKRVAAWNGIFDPQGRVRGRGAHRGDNGELILHCGDKVMIGGTRITGGPADPVFEEPGMIGRYVYPTSPTAPRPWHKPVDTSAGSALRALFTQWNWARELIDPYLLLGFTGAAMVAGALPWRPHGWITGGSGTGKSSLQKVMELVFGNGALTTGDATPAAVRQLLQQQTLPVFFDELEAEADGRKTQAVIGLARLASSGAQTFRGGTDHKASEFTVRSTFLFSSILVPPMPQQDRNRLAMLELEDLKLGAKAPDPYALGLPELGRKLRRRLVDQWWRFDDMFQSYKLALARWGHNGRSGDQFGTLLAIADLLLFDTDADPEIVEEWAERLKADTLAEKMFERTDSDECADHLGSKEVRARGGEDPETVWVMLQRGLDPLDGTTRRARLRSVGIALGHPTVTKAGAIGFRDLVGPNDVWVAIADSHTRLDELFKDKRWVGGVWSQSFGRAKVKRGDDVLVAKKRVKVKFDGRPIWATLVPIELFLGGVEEPE